MKEAINSAILLMFRKYDSFCLEINYKENQLNVESVFDLCSGWHGFRSRKETEDYV